MCEDFENSLGVETRVSPGRCMAPILTSISFHYTVLELETAFVGTVGTHSILSTWILRHPAKAAAEAE